MKPTNILLAIIAAAVVTVAVVQVAPHWDRVQAQWDREREQVRFWLRSEPKLPTK